MQNSVDFLQKEAKRGGEAGKTFLEKSFPCAPFKRLETRERNMGCRIVLPLRKFSMRFVRSPIGDPDLRSPSGFDFGLRPPLRMTREAEMVAQSLDLRRICWISGVIFLA